MLDAIKWKIFSGETIIRPLANGGRLYIERPQPFLCLYRGLLREEFSGTETLLTTQASYLIASDTESEDQILVKQLLETVLESLSTNFESVLLVEIWAASPGEIHPETGLFPEKIMLHATSRDAPQKILDEFDRALVSSNWTTVSCPEVGIVFGSTTGPEGMGKALSRRKADQMGVTLIGLEISPFYCDPVSGKLFPKVASEVRKNLGQAMKRALYTFTQTHTNYTPAHYHELGPGRLEEIDLKVDADLAQIDDAVELLLNVTPVNVSQAWHRFRHTAYSSVPKFLYRALRHDPSDLKRQLFTVPVDSVEDPTLHHIFTTKREELDRQISMLSDRGSANFLLGSQQIYGNPDESIIETATKVLELLPPHTHDDHASDFIDAMEFVEHAQNEIEHYQNLDPDLESTVIVESDIPGLMVAHGNLLVSKIVVVAKHRIDATLQHEIGTHVLTHHNGGCQPLRLLQTGLAGYEETQEGIAVLSEYLVGGLSRPRFRQVAARVVAVDQLVRGADFCEVFVLLHDQYGFSQSSAFNITMRVFRSGGFTKDVVYFRGLINLLEYLKSGGSMKSILIGKIALDHIEVTEELRWRQILKPPRLLPRYLNAMQSSARLDEILRSDRAAIDLILESFP
jgi:uncharacterized protein (TIGR02421 family)